MRSCVSFAAAAAVSVLSATASAVSGGSVGIPSGTSRRASALLTLLLLLLKWRLVRSRNGARWRPGPRVRVCVAYREGIGRSDGEVVGCSAIVPSVGVRGSRRRGA